MTSGGSATASGRERSKLVPFPAGRTRVIYETRPLVGVNDAISEVLHGKARLVLEP
ncbi:MAG TPA: hypothetical protein VIY52_06375 [Streptosporangiaceae bacterium]